jgi:LemA protein
MGMGSIVFWAILLLAALYAITIYNGLVALKHNVSRNLANIDVLLKQRHDELPKLIETCKQYMQYEQDTLENVIQARSQVFNANAEHNMHDLGQAEGALRNSLGKLFALAENYPDLKANQTFNNLQTRISSLENGIADRREVYNESVNNNNVRIEQFPDTIIAKQFNFKAFELLEFATSEKADIDVKQLFNS